MHQSTVALLLLLLMASATIQKKEGYIYDIQGRISCKLEKNWCWEVEPFQTVQGHDGRLTADEGCSTADHAEYKIIDTFNYDESRPNYEIGLTLIHSCTPTGAPKSIRLPSLWNVPSGKPEDLLFLKKDFNLP